MLLSLASAAASVTGTYPVVEEIRMSLPNAELIEAVYTQLRKLDGTTLAAVALITGLSLEELQELGGL